jgi:hypothetical protein
MDLAFKAPEHHGFIHFLTRINALDDEMAKAI